MDFKFTEIFQGVDLLLYQLEHDWKIVVVRAILIAVGEVETALALQARLSGKQEKS